MAGDEAGNPRGVQMRAESASGSVLPGAGGRALGARPWAPSRPLEGSWHRFFLNLRAIKDAPTLVSTSIVAVKKIDTKETKHSDL